MDWDFLQLVSGMKSGGTIALYHIDFPIGVFMFGDFLAPSHFE